MIKTTVTVYNTLREKVTEIFNTLNLNQHENTKGRPSLISNLDAVTLALFKQAKGIATKKSLFEILEPPCSYKTFVVSINRVFELLSKVIGYFIKVNRSVSHLVKHTDSTELPVCSVRKGKNHRTMRKLANWGKTSKGWFYGLKLHLSVDLEGRIVALSFSSGNMDDRKMFRKMNRDLKGLFIADAGYLSKELEREFHLEHERMLITCSRSNMKKVATLDEIELLKTRTRIEDNFGNLKQFHNLVSTVCRSVKGYLVNYLSSVLAYMIA